MRGLMREENMWLLLRTIIERLELQTNISKKVSQNWGIIVIQKVTQITKTHKKVTRTSKWFAYYFNSNWKSCVFKRDNVISI